MFNFARFTAALALAGAILSSPAYAAPVAEPRSVAVAISDLNLDSPRGRAALLRRIDHAAGLVCGRPDPRDLIASRLADRCHASAVDAAVPQIQLAVAGMTSGRRLASAVAVTTQGL